MNPVLQIPHTPCGETAEYQNSPTRIQAPRIVDHTDARPANLLQSRLRRGLNVTIALLGLVLLSPLMLLIAVLIRAYRSGV